MKKEGLLIILGGLPGSGKITIARLLAKKIGAVHLRNNTIENALRKFFFYCERSVAESC